MSTNTSMEDKIKNSRITIDNGRVRPCIADDADLRTNSVLTWRSAASARTSPIAKTVDANGARDGTFVELSLLDRGTRIEGRLLGQNGDDGEESGKEG